MDGNIDAGEVEDSGENGLQGHLGIGDAHKLGHQEGGGAHDGGHDLPAGGGGGLNGAGKLRLVAGLLHHGDGHRAGGHGVAHGGAGHHAAQSGGDDGHLGGTAGGGTSHGVGQIDEEVGDAGALQEGAEDDEDHDVLGTHLGGSAHHAVGGVEQVVDHLTKADVGKSINEQGAHHTQNGDAHAAPAQLSKGQDADDGDDHHEGLVGHCAGNLNDLLGVGGKVEEGPGPQYHNNQIIPGHIVDPHHPLLDGVVEVTDDQDQPQEHGQTDLQQAADKQGDIDTIGGKEGHNCPYDLLGNSFPNTDVGLTVIFFHDLIDCGGNIFRRVFRCVHLFFLFFFIIVHNHQILSPFSLAVPRLPAEHTRPHAQDGNAGASASQVDPAIHIGLRRTCPPQPTE